MNSLKFEDYFLMKEMAYGTFKWKGKEIGHINDLNGIQIDWVLKQLMNPKGSPVMRNGRPTGEFYPPARLSFKFMADDGSGRLSFDQVVQALNIRKSGGLVAPTSVNKPIEAVDSSNSDPAHHEPDYLEPDPESHTDSQKAIPPIENSEKYQIPAEKISDYQKSIEEAFANTDNHLVINALAGTGKTTILKHLAAKFSKGKKWLYLVFNRKNADEANSGEKSFPPNVEAMTSHSFLGRVLSETKKAKPRLFPSSQGGRSPNSEGEEEAKFGTKIKKITDHKWFYDIVSNLDETLPSQKRGFLIRWNRRTNREEVVYNLKSKVDHVVGLAKNFAIDPRELNASEKIKDIIRQYKIPGDLYEREDEDVPSTPDFTKEIVYLSLEILKATSPKGSIGDPSIDSNQDFDDLIWWPTLHPNEVIWPTKAKYEVALVDEVQDFNNAQKIMLENLAKNGIRIIVVGDPHQAIYRFRGADAKGFSNIESLLSSTSRGASTHDLPVNYRSGKKIIDFVNKTTHVKDLRAGRDHEGIVNPNAEEEELLSQVEDEFLKDGSLKEETAFISRNNAPLFGVALRMLKKGIPFQIIGTDFSGSILDFIYRVVGKDKIGIGKSKAKDVSLDEFIEMMRSYFDGKVQKYENKKDKEKYLEELEKMHAAMEGLVYHIQESQKNAELDSQQKTNISQPSIQWHTDQRGAPWDSYKTEEDLAPKEESFLINIEESNVQDIKNVQDLCNHIKELFKGISPTDKKSDADKYQKIDKKRTVMLTTAHRSKGLEFERVNIIHDDLFPDHAEFDPSDEEGVQEHNAKYVAYTRATHTLNLAKSPK